MYDNLVMYNTYGWGDCFINRGFIRYFMANFPAKNFIFRHAKAPQLFEDIKELQYQPLNGEEINTKHFFVKDNNYYLNTWIGMDSKYVLPGIACTMEMYCQMYSDIFQSSGIDLILEPHEQFFPEIDYSKINGRDEIDGFIFKYKGLLSDLVLISNGDVQSNQSDNFNFNPVVNRLAIDFPQKTFLLTQRTNEVLVANNIIYTDSLTNRNGGFDLNKLSYLSYWCDTIIGRSSGPYVFAQTYDNYFDHTKKFLSFTYTEKAAHFSYSLPIKARKYWSNDFSVDGIYNKICEVINAE